MAATRRKQSASATLDPPNLCTTQASVCLVCIEEGTLDIEIKPEEFEKWEEKAVRLYRFYERGTRAATYNHSWNRYWVPFCPCMNASGPPDGLLPSVCSWKLRALLIASLAP
jgi:hypothetical protein